MGRDEDVEERRQDKRRATDAVHLGDTPWQVRAAFMFGAPTVFAAYLIWALVSGIVPAMLQMQSTMSDMVVAISSLSADHQTSRQQNESVLRVLRATCINQAMTVADRERCLQ